jgi:hypothetical protein
MSVGMGLKHKCVARIDYVGLAWCRLDWHEPLCGVQCVACRLFVDASDGACRITCSFHSLDITTKRCYMGSIPSSPRPAVLAWCQAHIEIFTTNAVQIGLTVPQANAFATATVEYLQAAGDSEAARIAAETATRAAAEKYRVMRRSMTEAVGDIRQFASNAANPETVYELAQVPPRAIPSTLPPPGRPSDLTVELLDTTGALQLRWKCTNPPGTSGTSYVIRRKLPGENAYSFVGVTGERRFVDNTFIAGPDSVQYTVQGQRADRAGLESPVFTINFGLVGPGRANAGNAMSLTSTTTSPETTSEEPSANTSVVQPNTTKKRAA